MIRLDDFWDVAARLFPRRKNGRRLHQQRHLLKTNPDRKHYVICNADESEPGTFKDRLLMEGDPFAVLEGMTIAALATGAEQGYIYLRGEYPLAAERMAHAIESARWENFLGENILGSGLRFDIEMRRGAGAYICGEETALFNSIEGYRGEPRNKPPFPTQSGLFRQPDGRQQRGNADQRSNHHQSGRSGIRRALARRAPAVPGSFVFADTWSVPAFMKSPWEQRCASSCYGGRDRRKGRLAGDLAGRRGGNIYFAQGTGCAAYV